MKEKYLLLMFFVIGNMYCQVGVNTTLPMQPFHIDAKKDNPINGTPNATQIANDIVVDKEGQVGIGTITPTTKLDVKGGVTLDKTLKINNIGELVPDNVKSLFVNPDGVIGTAVVNKETSLAYFQNSSNINEEYTNTVLFNLGEEIEMPFSSVNNVLRLHVGDIVEVNGSGQIKIKQKGYYQLSLFISPYIEGGAIPKKTYNVTGSTTYKVEIENPADNQVFFRSTIQYSKDNGITWNTLVGIRPILLVSPGTYFYPQVFPTTIFELDKNDLIRVVYTRSKGVGAAVQGKAVVGISINSNTSLGLNAYQFSISKL